MNIVGLAKRSASFYNRFLDQYKLRLEMIRERSKDAFAEIQDQSIMKGFKAGYEAAAGDIIEKFRDLAEFVGLTKEKVNDIVAKVYKGQIITII